MTTRDATPSSAATEPVRVLLVSDVRLHRESLAISLRACDGISVVGEATDAPGALAAAKSVLVEIVLLDLATDRALDIVRAIVQELPVMRVVAFGVHDVQADVLACAEAGVAGCFPSDGTLDELAELIRGVRRDEITCPPRMAAALFRRVASLARAVSTRRTPLPLTDRETEIASLIDAGLSNKEIAKRLNVEVATVKNHVHHILEKLHVNTRREVAAVFRLGAASTRMTSSHDRTRRPPRP
jgi:two-component system nitrate/nitrite response regulator NarL